MGTAAQYIALPASLVRPLPSNASFVEGACFGIPAMTGFRAVFADGPVKRKTVYVPGATGRVGAYAVQFAKWGGARRTLATSGGRRSPWPSTVTSTGWPGCTRVSWVSL